MKTNTIYIFIFVILFACTQDMKNINNDINVKEKPFSSKGFAKLLLAIAEGKRKYDKRQLKKEKEWKKEKIIY